MTAPTSAVRIPNPSSTARIRGPDPPARAGRRGAQRQPVALAQRAALEAAQAAAHLKQKLGIGFGETTADGLFTLKEGECFGACGDAPVVLVNNKRMCSWMKPEQLDGLIAELSAEAKR